MLKNLKLDFWIHVGFSVAIVALVAGFLFVLNEVKKVKDNPPESSTVYITQQAPVTYTPSPAFLTSTFTPTPSIAPTPKIIVQTQVSQQKVTSYVPFSNSFTTTNTDWTDAPGNQAYIDLKNNYSINAYVTFEASIRTISGGEVRVRLLDSTHGTAVDGSEISTTSTTSTLVSSGRLNLWSGNNLYKVQVKSLDSSNVAFDSGKIKIVY